MTFESMAKQKLSIMRMNDALGRSIKEINNRLIKQRHTRRRSKVSGCAALLDGTGGEWRSCKQIKPMDIDQNKMFTLVAVGCGVFCSPFPLPLCSWQIGRLEDPVLSGLKLSVCLTVNFLRRIKV